MKEITNNFENILLKRMMKHQGSLFFFFLKIKATSD